MQLNKVEKRNDFAAKRNYIKSSNQVYLSP